MITVSNLAIQFGKRVLYNDGTAALPVLLVSMFTLSSLTSTLSSLSLVSMVTVLEEAMSLF